MNFNLSFLNKLKNKEKNIRKEKDNLYFHIQQKFRKLSRNA